MQTSLSKLTSSEYGKLIERVDISVSSIVAHSEALFYSKKEKRVPEPIDLKHDFVFTYLGQPLTQNRGFKQILKNTCNRAKVPYGQKTLNGVIFHDIHRTVKTNMLNAGMDKSHRDTILGHSLKGMDVHYIVPTDEPLTRAMDKYTRWFDRELFSANVDQSVDHGQSPGI